MYFQEINPYLWLRPLLFLLDAEQAHHLVIGLLKKGLAPRFKNNLHRSLRTTVCGLTFPNVVGLAAGFDKQIEVIDEMFGFGFGAVELGSITPQPQPGNPRPRLFRVPEVQGIINRFGFNSDGFDICLRRIIAYRDETVRQASPGIIGINIGKNKDSANAPKDYLDGVKAFGPYADYLTINISSPNTPGLRDLQGEGLGDLLGVVQAARNTLKNKPPVFVKIAPDQSDEQLTMIASAMLASGLDGLIVGNTTVARPASLPAHLAKEAGGLSGKPLLGLSTTVLAKMYRLTGGKLPLIGCGGIASGADAYAKIRAGASLVQLYSALIYQGPLLVPRINRELAMLLRRDGFTSVQDAVGTAA